MDSGPIGTDSLETSLAVPISDELARRPNAPEPPPPEAVTTESVAPGAADTTSDGPRSPAPVVGRPARPRARWLNLVLAGGVVLAAVLLVLRLLEQSTGTAPIANLVQAEQAGEAGAEAPPRDPALQGGVDALREGAFEEAERAFKRCLDREPDDLDALTGLARSYLLQDKLSEARATLEKVIQRRPDDASAYLYLGMADNGLGDRVAARGALQRFLELAPEDPAAPKVRKLLGRL